MYIYDIYVYMYIGCNACLHSIDVHIYTCIFIQCTRWTKRAPLSTTHLGLGPCDLKSPRIIDFLAPRVAKWLSIMYLRRKGIPGDGLAITVMEIVLLPLMFDKTAPLWHWNFLVGVPVSVFWDAITPEAEASARELGKARGGACNVYRMAVCYVSPRTHTSTHRYAHTHTHTLTLTRTRTRTRTRARLHTGGSYHPGVISSQTRPKRWIDDGEEEPASITVDYCDGVSGDT